MPALALKTSCQGGWLQLIFRKMRAMLSLALLLVMPVGCGKQRAASDPQKVNPAQPGVAETSQADLQPNLDSVLNDLTQRVRKYAMEKMRTPKDLAELVSGGYLERIPATPAGKKYAIDRKLQVYLEDQ